jgi:hypothetical protein
MTPQRQGRGRHGRHHRADTGIGTGARRHTEPRQRAGGKQRPAPEQYNSG